MAGLTTVEQEVEILTEPWDDLDDQTFYCNVKDDKNLMSFLKTNRIPWNEAYINDFNNILLNGNIVSDTNEPIINLENAVQAINSPAGNSQNLLMGSKDYHHRRETKQRESCKKKRKIDRCSPDMEEHIAFVVDYISQSTITCEICSVNTSSREDLLNHMSKIHQRKLLYCCNCDFKTIYKPSLKEHEKHHSQIKYFKCKYCEFSTNNILRFENHELFHTKLKPFPCDECHFRAKTKDSLRQHKKLHSGDMPFLCSYCNYKTIKSSRIIRHELIHTGERPFACPQCNFSCNQRSTLKIHIRRHTGEKPYECHLCSFKAVSKCSLNAHLKKHNSSKGVKYICSVCEQIYFTKTVFLKHEKSHEEAAAMDGYMKPIINKKRKSDYLAETAISSSISTVSSKQERKRHRTSSSSARKSKKSEKVVEDISTSPIARLYKCPKCPYRCSTLSELRDHMSSHKESENAMPSPVIPKEYHCTPCNLSFSSKREMKRHLKEKPEKKNKEMTIKIGKYKLKVWEE